MRFTAKLVEGEEVKKLLPTFQGVTVEAFVCVFFFFFFFSPFSSMLISKPDVMMMFMSYQTRKTNIEGSRGEEI